MEQAKRGRPFLPQGERKDVQIKMMMTSAFKLKLQIAADYEGMNYTSLIRKAIAEYFDNHGYVFDGCNIVNKPKIK
jgi:predicted DNA binding CopG/RHH family protein